jgi:hypothetical protein
MTVVRSCRLSLLRSWQIRHVVCLLIMISCVMILSSVVVLLYCAARSSGFVLTAGTCVR